MNIHWNGTGLPPVGVTVEFSLNRGEVAWRVGNVLAHDGVFAVIKYGDEYHPRNTHGVRRIVSLEEIAEEKRNVALSAMCGIFMRSEEDVIRVIDCCERLYDAGYRKFEIVEEDV